MRDTPQDLIVEDHPLYADALETTLRALDRDALVHKARTFDAAARFTEQASIGLVLLDLWLPDTVSFGGVIEMRARLPQAPIVVISGCSSDDAAAKSLVCGATSFIPKSATRAQIERGIAEALAGQTMMADDDKVDLKFKLLVSRMRSLTLRQLQVLHLMCLGLSNNAIAERLGVSITTGKAHAAEILRKLKVTSRLQAVLAVEPLKFKTCAFADLVPSRKEQPRSFQSSDLALTQL